MQRIKNIILDWSGTLADDFGPVVDATNQIFAEYGKPAFTHEEFREKFRLPFTEFYQEYLPEAQMVQLEHYYHSAFKLLQEDIPLLPHAKDFLDFCQAEGMPMFLLSTIHAEHFEVQGTRLGVKHYFKKAYVQIIDKRKAILQLLADHDLEPGETMFIGDMQHDVDTAKHGGVVSCAMLTGYDSLAKLQKSGPDHVFRDLGAVRRFLESRKREVAPAYFPLATVGAAVRNGEGKFLMIRTHKWSNLWGIPGGKIKTDEPAADAVRREVLEETGLELGETKFVMVQDCIRSEEFFRPAHFLLLNYLAETQGHEVVLNDEAEEYRWVGMDEALRMALNTPTRTLLEEMVKQKLV
jgi:phosphoglycolate phosphatase-like HAD superfamily hydrolase/ADP-ribose pyrophosphatase YjhB (NUDIX family)